MFKRKRTREFFIKKCARVHGGATITTKCVRTARALCGTGDHHGWMFAAAAMAARVYLRRVGSAVCRSMRHDPPARLLTGMPKVRGVSGRTEPALDLSRR